MKPIHFLDDQRRTFLVRWALSHVSYVSVHVAPSRDTFPPFQGTLFRAPLRTPDAVSDISGTTLDISERKGKERKGKERKGKERKGKEHNASTCSWDKLVAHFLAEIDLWF